MAEQRAPDTDGLWRLAADLFGRRRLLTFATVFAAVASVIISLLLPKQFTAQARVMPPESSGGVGSAFLGSLSGVARAFLGSSGSGDYSRYLSILSSRSLLQETVTEFNLTDVYGLDDDTPRSIDLAIATLAGNTDLTVDAEYEFLAVSVTDRDPSRAAELANYMVAMLNEMNAELASQSASNLRRYVERRYDEAKTDRDSLFRVISAFQSEYGLFDVTTQMEAYFSQLAEVRAAGVQAEIEHEALRALYGDENNQVKFARQTLLAANRKYADALGGSEAVLPVARDSLPDVGRQYANLELQRAVQVAILETITPVLEQARFEERRKSEAVQVVDPAVPPSRKSHPRRSLIAIFGTLSVFLLTCLYVAASAMWRRNSGYIADRLTAAD